MKIWTLLAWMLLFVVAPAVAAAPKTLPAATGVYAIGSRTLDFTDISREEPWTTESDTRRLQVQLWYPALKLSGGKQLLYVRDLNLLESSLRSYWGDNAASELSFAVPNARDSALIVNKRFPLLILSHGMNASRSNLTSLAIDLASHGYIVAAIEHSYWTPGVAFQDGKTVTFQDGMMARDKLSSAELDRYMAEGIRTFSADQSFVARRLLALSTGRSFLAGRIDATRIGAVGHSMGGMASDLTCLHDTMFKACASLDGTLGMPVHVGLEPRCSAKPFLLIASAQYQSRLATDSPVAARLNLAWCAPRAFVLTGSRHSSFTDLPWLSAVSPAEIDSGRAIEITRKAVHRFFGAAFTRVHADFRDLPELSVVDWRPTNPDS